MSDVTTLTILSNPEPGEPWFRPKGVPGSEIVNVPGVNIAHLGIAHKEIIFTIINFHLTRFFSFLEFSVIYWIRNNFPILCHVLKRSVGKG